MAKRKFRIEFELEDDNGLPLPIELDTVHVSVQPEGEKHWAEVGNLAEIDLHLEVEPNHPGDNRLVTKTVNPKYYSTVPLGKTKSLFEV